MGKAQKKRAMRRHNPVRVPDAHLPHGLATAAASTSSKKRDAIIPVIEKLESTDQQERIWACAAISNLIQNDPSTRRLLQGKNIVGLLITRLSDEVEEVVVEAAGALRNLCIDGGFEICAEMFNKGILEPLKSFVPKISTILSQIISGSKDTPELATRFAYDFAENVITIFWCLSETSNKALNAVNQVKLIPFLMAFLDPASRNKIPISTVIAAAQCLYVFTEENDVATDEVRMNSLYVNCLVGIARGDVPKSKPNAKDLLEHQTSAVKATLLRTLVCGIIHNISPLPPLLSASAIDMDRLIILPFLLPLLSLNLSETASQVQSLLAIQEKETLAKQQPTLKNGAKSDHKSTSAMALDRIESELWAVKLALELITSICAELPEGGDTEDIVDEEEEEEEWEDDEDDAMVEEDEEMVETETQTARGSVEPSSSAKSVDLIGTVIPACLLLIQPTPLSYPPAFQSSPHPPTTSALGSIHIAALECLNNLCLSIAQLGISSSLYQSSLQQFNLVWAATWQMLAALGLPEPGLGSGPEQKRQVWSLSLGLLWAVGRIGAEEEQKLDLVPEEEKVRVLIDMCEQAGDAEVSVKAIGILERLAMHPNPDLVEVNKMISEFILSFLPNSPGPQRNAQSDVVIQAASSIIDIYSDEASSWDVNFRQGKYNEILKNSIPGFRKTVKSVDKRKEGGRELRRRGDEVLENLVAFVKYRKGLKL